MTVTTPPSTPTTPTETDQSPYEDHVVTVTRRRLDTLFIALGAVVTVVLLVAGGLLTWGSRFADDYVGDELSSQNITFPSAEALEEEGRTDLLSHAGQTVDTGEEAEAYASYIDGHLQNIADGATYADLGATERQAEAAVEEAQANGASADEVAALQAEADGVTAQRNTLFKGETLRGLLLSAYAWSTVGMIAGIAAIGAFVAAAVMLVLTVLGIRHHHKVAKA